MAGADQSHCRHADAPVSGTKRVADSELEGGTPDCADLGFGEQPAGVGEPDQPVEAALRLRVVRHVVNVQGRAAAHVQVPCRHRRGQPRRVARQAIRELEIHCEQRAVVSDADLQIRLEPQVVGELATLDVDPAVELVRVDARADAPADALRARRTGRHEERGGDDPQMLLRDAHRLRLQRTTKMARSTFGSDRGRTSWKRRTRASGRCANRVFPTASMNGMQPTYSAGSCSTRRSPVAILLAACVAALSLWSGCATGRGGAAATGPHGAPATPLAVLVTTDCGVEI